MEIKNIDLIYSTSGNRIYPASMESFIINQYATNYKLRVGIYYSDTDTEKLFIKTVKAVIFNGKSNPARVLYNDGKTTYSGKEVELYTYQLTQYDTYLYNENMEISINITLQDGTEFMDTISLPMTKQNFGKITPPSLESDDTLNSVIEGTNIMREDINRILEGGGQFPAEILPEPNSLVLRDENGRSKVEDPEQELDIANKKYADTKVTKVSSASRLYATNPSGVQTTIPYGTSPTANYIVQRGSGGQIASPAPSNDLHVTNRGYVTEVLNAKALEVMNAASAYTDTKISDLIDSSPSTLNTLNELAAALGDDPNFATTVLTRIGEDEKIISSLEVGKVDKLTTQGTGLVYAVNPKGITVGIPLTEEATPESVPFRDLNGTFNICDPVEYYHPATKGYTDTELAKKLNKPTTKYTVPSAIIMAANSNTQTVIGISQTDATATNGRLVSYRASTGGTTEPAGKLVTGTPTQKYQAATKKYVDDSVAGAINGTVKAGAGISISTDTSVTPNKHTITADVTQSEVDAKLSKVSTTSRIYATTSSGSQTTLTYSPTSATANYIVQRTTGGQIIVPATPTATTHAASKSYVDSKHVYKHRVDLTIRSSSYDIIGDIIIDIVSNSSSLISTLTLIKTYFTNNGISIHSCSGFLNKNPIWSITVDSSSNVYLNNTNGGRTDLSTYSSITITDTVITII